MLILLLCSCSSTDSNERWLDMAFGLPPEEAVGVYEKAVLEDPSPELRFNLAYTYLLLGEWDKAIAVSDEALDEDPGSLRFDYLKAYAYRESNRYYSYEMQLETILEKDPGNIEIRLLLARRYAAQGRRDPAIEQAKDVLRRDPSNSSAINILALYYDFYAAIADSKIDESPDKEPWDSSRPALYNFLSLLGEKDRLDSALLSYADENLSGKPRNETQEEEPLLGLEL